MRRAAKVDANQTQIVSALRAAGASVLSLAPIGKGCPDLLAAYTPRGADKAAMFLIECKHGKGKTNELQKKWHDEWKADVHVAYTAEEALKAIGAIA